MKDFMKWKSFEYFLRILKSLLLVNIMLIFTGFVEGFYYLQYFMNLLFVGVHQPRQKSNQFILPQKPNDKVHVQNGRV